MAERQAERAKRRVPYSETSMGAVRALCPFYVRDAGQQVTCEGLTDGATTKMCFASHGRKRKWMQAKCNAIAFGECPLAAALLDEAERRYGHEV